MKNQTGQTGQTEQTGQTGQVKVRIEVILRLPVGMKKLDDPKPLEDTIRGLLEGARAEVESVTYTGKK